MNTDAGKGMTRISRIIADAQELAVISEISVERLQLVELLFQGSCIVRPEIQVLGCVGRGTVNKFAEIVAGVVLAGEISLGSAISSSDFGGVNMLNFHIR